MSDWPARVLVTITGVKGSAPREAGASMVITKNGHQTGTTGTIGGGALEWQATDKAKKLLKSHSTYTRREHEVILGPDLEQCCGGVVRLSFELFTAAEKHRFPSASNDQQNLMLFGAGHVGKALVNALANHSFNVRWIDTRPDIFPHEVPANVEVCHTGQPELELSKTDPNTFVLIMTHCHKLDFQISSTALQCHDVTFTGLIGSATKKARFVKRYADTGLKLDQISKLTCPIGIKEITSKNPESIAASVVAQLLIQMELVKTARNTVLLKEIRA